MKNVCHKLSKYIYYGMNQYRTNAGSENLFKNNYNIIYLI